MRLEQENRKSLLRSAEFGPVQTFIAEMMLKNFDYELSPGSRENLERHRASLSNGSIVVYLNHITREDPFLAGALSVREFRRQLTGVMAPIGARHYVEFQKKSRAKAELLRRAHLLGVELCPVPQPYYEEEFSQAEITKMNRTFIRTGKKVLNRSGGLLLIAPEGTRSPDGSIQEAQPGVEHLHKFGQAVHFAPWAFIPLETYDRKVGLGRVRLNIGAPRLKEEIQEEWMSHNSSGKTSFTDVLMYNLAALLPENMRGVYGQE